MGRHRHRRVSHRGHHLRDHVNMALSYGQKWPTIAKQWDAMKYSPGRAAEFSKLAAFAIKNKARYQLIERQTGVPWVMVAALHRRESNADFSTYMGNGEPLNRLTRLVPKGRGPFTGPTAFEDGASDAFKIDALTSVKDWRLEKMLWYCERFNGIGYEKRGLPSPYIWGGTSVQKPKARLSSEVNLVTSQFGGP